jgi:hypothetical protein
MRAVCISVQTKQSEWAGLEEAVAPTASLISSGIPENLELERERGEGLL